jgi:hypothetical protein
MFPNSSMLETPLMPQAADIERVFTTCFLASHNTVLTGGAAEPFYRPADEHCTQHCIVYRDDFVSSSLHEVAHWLVAGAERRLLPDWGYWYAPDGRSAEQQQQFQQVEIKPQALEWLLHKACGLPFRVSLDNLGDGAGDGHLFKNAVFTQANDYLTNGVNDRARIFYRALAVAFGGPLVISELCLSRQELDD